MVRTTFGIFFGILIAGLALAACLYAAMKFYPLPAGISLQTPEMLAAFMAAIPGPAIACVLAGLALAGLTGGWAAAKIAKAHRGGAALCIGALVTLTLIFYATRLPGPEWIVVVGLLLPIPFAVGAGLLAMPRHQA